jgi:hypothetical protein
MMKYRLVLIAAAVPLTTPAFAQGGSPLDRVTACRALAPDAERLACFDRAAAELDTAKRDKTLIVLDRQEVKQKRRSLFGLKLPDIDLFGRDEAKDPPIPEIDTTLASVRSAGRDRLLFRFADGSTWRSIELARDTPDPGMKVKIKRAAMGTYRASFGGEYPIRVERVE